MRSFVCSYLLVGPSVPPAVSYTKRGQALSVESDHREEWDGARRLELSTSKGDVPASPVGVQERKKTTSAVGVRKMRKTSLKSLMQCRLTQWTFPASSSRGSYTLI